MAQNPVYSKTLELEKELRVLLKKKNVLDKTVVQLRNRLRDAYEELLFSELDFSLSQEVEQSLWKTAFYKVIEEYRKRLRKYGGGVTQVSDRSGGGKEELQKLCESFRGFLAQSTKFYEDLVAKLQERYNLVLDGSVQSKVGGKEGGSHRGYLSCHRCFIFLGDLARYHRDLHITSEMQEGMEDDWSQASVFYLRAISLVPDNGNPHNQLAVLATYEDDDLKAVYRYFRSLAVLHPFVTARDNLVVLFEKNRLKLQPSSERSSSDSSRFLSRFKTQFVRLHGILFTKTSLETFESLENAVVKDFSRLLKHNSVSEDLMFQLFVINIFATFNSMEKASESNVTFGSALSLSFQMFSELASWCALGSPAGLASVGVFVDFLGANPDLVSKPKDQKLQREWQAVSKSLAKLLSTAGDFDVNAVPSDSVLPEEKELSAFVPLHQAYSSLSTNQLQPHEVLQKRIAKVFRFAREHGLKKGLLHYEKGTGFSDRPFKKLYHPNNSPEKTFKPRQRPLVKALAEVPEVREIAVPAKNGFHEPLPVTSPEPSVSNGGSLPDPGLDDMDEEVILFKPGEGAQVPHVSKEAAQPRSAIGSGRGDHSPVERNQGPESPRFDLFSYGYASPTKVNPETNESLFSNFESSFHKQTPTGSFTLSSNHFTNGPNPANSKVTTQTPDQGFNHATSSLFWSPMLSTASQSFFSSGYPASSASNGLWNQPDSSFAIPATETAANGPTLFPFPGGTKVSVSRPKTRNPFIS